MKCANPECNHTIIKNRPHHKYCDMYCRNRASWLRRKPFSRKGPLTQEAMKEKMARGMDTRYKNAMMNLPDRYYLVINKIIQHKIRLPAQLISVRGVMTGVLRDIQTTKDVLTWPEKEIIYYIIAHRLEEEGGELTDLTGYSTSSTVKRKAYQRRVYRFPPLKERKT